MLMNLLEYPVAYLDYYEGWGKSNSMISSQRFSSEESIACV